MSLKFEFDNFRDASKFGKNLSRNLGATSKHEHSNNKHVIIVSEKNLNGIAATALTVSIVTAGLISGQHYLDEERFALVVDAMQRANPALESLQPHQIGEYLSTLGPEQMQGIVSNTKGVYHEMLYVEMENSDGDQIEAELHPELNHEGSDVVLSSNGEIHSEVQLKATDSVSYINNHLEKHPNIEVIATDEVAANIDNVEGSGISNESIEQDVTSSIDKLVSSSDSTDTASESASSVITDEAIGLGPVSIITGLLFGI